MIICQRHYRLLNLGFSSNSFFGCSIIFSLFIDDAFIAMIKWKDNKSRIHLSTALRTMITDVIFLLTNYQHLFGFRLVRKLLSLVKELRYLVVFLFHFFVCVILSQNFFLTLDITFKLYIYFRYTYTISTFIKKLFDKTKPNKISWFLLGKNSW